MLRVFLAAIAFGAATGSPSPPSIFVDLGYYNSSMSLQQKIAVQVCAGLFNRAAASSGVYVFQKSEDVDWLQEIYGVESPALTPVGDFLSLCLAGSDGAAPVAKGYLRYEVLV